MAVPMSLMISEASGKKRRTLHPLKPEQTPVSKKSKTESRKKGQQNGTEMEWMGNNVCVCFCLSFAMMSLSLSLSVQGSMAPAFSHTSISPHLSL